MERNISLIGAGNWGKNHLRNLKNLGVLHSVLELSEDITTLRKKEHPDVAFTSDENDILNNTSIKGVVIAAPAHLHYEIAKKYLLAGKDVLVEKPLALKVEEGEELVGIAERKNRILMVGHILQFHAAVIRLKKLIDDGELGELRYIYSNRLNIGKLRSEENVLWSFAPHDISLILMLLGGEEPSDITAFGGAYVNEKIYDTTMTTLKFGSGVRGHIFVSWLHPFKEQKLVVVGSEKMAVFDDVSQEKLFVYPHTIEIEDGNIPVAHKADREVVEFEPSQPLEEELKHFVNCMENRDIPKTDGNEGVRVLRILNKAGYFLR